jgi:competence protein ComEA
MRRICFAAVAILLSTVAASAQTPEPGAKLPPGDGRDLVMKTCSKCHTPDIVAEQTLDADGWKELVNQMAGNGAQGSDDDFAKISDYLAKSFPAK